MKNTYLLFTVFVVLLLSCGGPKKQVLEPEVESNAIAQRDSTQQSLVVYNAAKMKNRVKTADYKKRRGRRNIDPNNPPVKLSLWKEDLPSKEIDLADFYNKVTFVKLKHPLTAAQGGFLGDSYINISYSQGSSSSRGVNSVVSLSKNQIVAGDKCFGFHVYDLSGKFIYTLAQIDYLPNYDRRSNTVSLNWSDSKWKINNVSVLENTAMISVHTDSIGQLHIYDIRAQKGKKSISFYANKTMLIDSEDFISYSSGAHMRPGAFMFSLNDEGDILYDFNNYNTPVKREKGSFTNPEQHFFYYQDGILTMRQAYNDTVYRMPSASTLVPALVLDMGKKKLDTQSAFQGSKEGKLIVNDFLETDKFVYINCTENHDTPNNRKAGTVKYLYFFYDKQESKLYKMASKDFPEEYLMKNSIENGLPLLLQTSNVYMNKVYASFSRIHLEKIMNSAMFSNLSLAQQQQIKELYEGLTDEEILVMILE